MFAKDKSKTIILHLGFHKTASTSIQTTLAHNRKFLAKYNFLYPAFHLFNKSYNNHSFPINSIFAKRNKKNKNQIEGNWEQSEIAQIFTKQFDKYLNDSKSVIFSGEGVSILAPAELKLLKQKLENTGKIIRPIIFVREPLAYLISSTQQKLKGEAWTIERTVAEDYAAIDIEKIKKIKAIFPYTEFYSFDEACAYPGGPVAYFLHLLDFDPEKFEIIKKNESISMPAAQLLNYLNHRCAIFLGDRDRLNYTRSSRETKYLEDIQGPKFSLLQSQIAPHYDYVLKAKNEIEKIANIKFADKNITIANFPTEFTWDETSILSFTLQIPFLSEGILYRSYDYFYDLHKENKLTKQHLDLIGIKIDDAINNGIRLNKQNVQLIIEAAQGVMGKPHTAIRLLKMVEKYPNNDANVKSLIKALEEKIFARKMMKKNVFTKVKKFIGKLSGRM